MGLYSVPSNFYNTLSSGSGQKVYGKANANTGSSLGSANEDFTNRVTANQTQNQNSRKVENTSSYGRTNETSAQTQNRRLQNVSDPVLNLINNAASSITGNQTLQSADLAKQAAAERAVAALNGFDPNAAIAGAQGNVADLSRKLLEQVLPQLLGSVEASGTSNNALATLSAQDAAIRTGEAQARVMEQARQNSAAELLALIQGTTQAGNVGSSMQDAITALTNAAKGTVDQGFIQDVQNKVTEALKNSTTTTDTTSTSNTTGAENTLNLKDATALQNQQEQQRLAKFALLQSMISPFQNVQDMFNTGSRANRYNTSGINQLATKIGL